MNKAEFINFIAENNNCSKAEATRMLDIFTGSVIKALGQDKEISLIGFGRFYVQKREARVGRNPRTGENMKIAAYKQPAFKSGKNLKDSSNRL